MDRGIIYLMSSAAEGIVKIGISTKKRYNGRMLHLENNGYHNVTGFKREFAIDVDNYKSKEKLLHRVLRNCRISNSELFSLGLEDAKQLLSALDGDIVYTKDKENLSKEEVLSKVTDELNKNNPIKKETKPKKKTGQNKFKETHFHSNLTGLNYYFPTSENGLIVCYEETNEEIPNYSNPPKKQILKSAVIDLMGKNTPENIESMTLYQLARQLQKIVKEK